MQPGTEDFEDVQFLTGSPQRYGVLSSLCESSARPCELCDEVDATRTTIQRILAGFRERQWVVKRDGEYRPTVTGRRVCEQYQSLLSEIERARDFGPLATHLDTIDDDLPTEALESGRLTVGSDGNPLAAVNRFTEWFRAVDGDVRAVSPIVAQPFNEVGAELLASGTSIEFVIDQTVLERSEQEYGEALERGLDHDRISIYIHEDPLMFGLVVDGASRCCLAAYDEHNNIRALLETGGAEVVDWATGVFERHRDRAKPLSAVYS
ncbi:MarR family transcriptional regulator [Halomicroarcula sp. S1AR25-4]|uniref:helix-turn-helix transcriptional regulator n=1 Tax=Haloarcula sp. S1AR25-4 TaxID=2950538 RepID=UPI002874ED5A|nr:MarR family transcriptional regulator [Halomicroarcula sp. S1AR25-4]MDS0277587.1 MarR family transcriptional regulator [Halomicroarcula sp. S1AR25-4]